LIMMTTLLVFMIGVLSSLVSFLFFNAGDLKNLLLQALV
jgi:hypothetical protein